MKELEMYDDIFDQGGAFELTTLITRLTDTSVTADLVMKRDGKIWCVARDYVLQRFKNYLPVWNVILKPQHNRLSHEVAPGIFFYLNTSEDNVLGLLSKRYLNHVESAEFDELGSPGLKRERLISRIALKDAVRSLARRDSDEMLYPIEIFSVHSENGKPTIYGEGEAAGLLEGIEVSLAHKGDAAIAVASKEPIGIDLERIEEKAESFGEAVFTPRERELLASLQQPEAAIRFWVAKEACAKKAGTGLEGNPRRFEVSAVDGEVLSIGGMKVQTMALEKEYIAGWTI
jgi:phosphopantetheine--protein transferase-like protein